jgi:hypothetical protein
MFDIPEADIVCMQKTKIQKKDLRDEMVLLKGWDCFFTFPKYKGDSTLQHVFSADLLSTGYSGVAIYRVPVNPSVTQSRLKKASPGSSSPGPAKAIFPRPPRRPPKAIRICHTKMRFFSTAKVAVWSWISADLS